MDIRDLLSVDHREVLQLARLVGRSDNPDCRIAAHRKLDEALQRHARAEEGVVHAAFSGVQADAQAALCHAQLEHALVSRLVRQLEAELIRPDGWQATWQELVEAMVRHIDEEERQLFPQLCRCFCAGQRDALAQRYIVALREEAHAAAAPL